MSPGEELRDLGLSPAQAQWLRRKYREKAPAFVRENPYRLAREVPGIGFKTADVIASRLGLPEDSPERIRAGIAHALRAQTEEGHVCLPFHRLVQESQSLLQTDRRHVADEMEAMASDGELLISPPPAGVERDRAVYLPPYFTAETRTAEVLLSLCRDNVLPRPIDVSSELDRAQAGLGLALAPRQAEALRAALGRRLTVITGGPGTGKTTVLRMLLEVCDRTGIRALLAAPTGRAARRMSEASGREAKTIHRMLEYAPAAGGFRKNRSDPLACDLLVVDEASMVDTILMHHLLRAVPSECALVLVGDANQLPSVGAGQVLRDIIASGRASVVELTEVFRQARESGIVANAHRILLGLLPEEDQSRPDRDFFFIEEENPARAAETIVEMVRDTVPRRLPADPIDGIQVLAPMHKGDAGAANLNRALQDALNPGGAPVDFSRLFGPAGHGFRVGDKVMQRRNSYDKGVFNGDVGRIIEARPEKGIVVSFDGEEVSYAPEEADQLALAYALSVHKSQGSEYPAVVLSILGEHAVMLQRNLLYTAVTRARRLMVIVGSRAALSTAVKRTESRRRHTGLAEMLKAGSASLF
jgi:exodeoxyribonuclease V alpha subunit